MPEAARNGTDHLVINVCPNCQPGAEEHLTREQQRDHEVDLVIDWAVMKSLQMIHGEKAGFIKFLRDGGVLHMDINEARKMLGLPEEDANGTN